MRTLLRDARYGLRVLTKNPAFAAAAVLSAGLSYFSVSISNFFAWREQSRSFEALGAYREDGFNLLVNDERCEWVALGRPRISSKLWRSGLCWDARSRQTRTVPGATRSSC